MIRILQISILCFFLVAGISISSSEEEEETIYKILQDNGLPSGIFPKGVTEFTFDGETGRFSVYLNQSCDAKYETELRYDTNITGTLSSANVTDLSGISAQDLFLWFPVKGIRVDVPSSGLIYFDVGVVRKQYSLSVFETPRDCVAVRRENEVESSVLSLHRAVLIEEATAHPCGRTFLSALIQLVPCRPSVAPFSTLSPNGLCCAAIKRLGQPCLCALSKGPPISGVDRTLSLQLPGKCSANFPPCN
ncbi:hypothetical protein HID58_068753 [Brassica napus]|uniref:Bifunctional inhibitor/plant lipid transfer protein/seed storage helical domain-containing protein n=1 Tax=Brassica napus TaxID=3708 RepID=A0ABQ7ZM87_BRANA|nr:hypothetical protein HID58_068753 [Brassica napus]